MIYPLHSTSPGVSLRNLLAALLIKGAKGNNSRSQSRPSVPGKRKKNQKHCSPRARCFPCPCQKHRAVTSQVSWEPTQLLNGGRPPQDTHVSATSLQQGLTITRLFGDPAQPGDSTGNYFFFLGWVKFSVDSVS